MGTVRVRYVEAHTKARLPKGSKNLAMDAFLMSDRVQDVADEAAADIREDARKAAIAAGLVRRGNYVRGFGSGPGRPKLVAGNVRRTSVVYNTERHGLELELGNSRMAAHHIIWRAGVRYHTMKRGIA